MGNQLLISLGLFAALGCKSGAKSELVEKMAGFRDQMCACTTADCATAVTAAMDAWSASDESRRANEPKLTAEQDKKLDDVIGAMVKCEKRFEAAAPPPDAAPAGPPDALVPRFDPSAPDFGLAPKPAGGWVPQLKPDRPGYMSFKRPGSVTPIHARVLDGPIPENAKALGKDAALVALLNLESVKKVSGEEKTPHGWRAEVRGKSAVVSLQLAVYVEILRHGDRAIMCHALLGDSGVGDKPIAAEDARDACGSLAPAP